MLIEALAANMFPQTGTFWNFVYPVWAPNSDIDVGKSLESVLALFITCANKTIIAVVPQTLRSRYLDSWMKNRIKSKRQILNLSASGCSKRIHKKFAPNVKEIAMFQVSKDIHRSLIGLERIIGVPNDQPRAGFFERALYSVKMDAFSLGHE